MARQTKIGLRKKIKDLYYVKGKTIQEIMNELEVTYFQVYNVISDRVKTDYTPRADKGKSRKKTIEEQMSKYDPSAKVEDFDSVDLFLQHQLCVCLEDLRKTNLNIKDKVRMLKDISAMQKNIEDRKLERYIKRPDAVLIARIMRRFKPELTDDEIIQIYGEEFEKLSRDINEQAK